MSEDSCKTVALAIPTTTDAKNAEKNKFITNLFTKLNRLRPADRDYQPPHTMTPQQLAIFIDKKSRAMFPIMFLVFNAMYWIWLFFCNPEPTFTTY